jgi:hypothetical protein
VGVSVGTSVGAAVSAGGVVSVASPPPVQETASIPVNRKAIQSNNLFIVKSPFKSFLLLYHILMNSANGKPHQKASPDL